MRRISLKFTLDDEVGYLSQPFRQSPEALQGVICLTLSSSASSRARLTPRMLT